MQRREKKGKARDKRLSKHNANQISRQRSTVVAESGPFYINNMNKTFACVG